MPAWIFDSLLQDFDLKGRDTMSEYMMSKRLFEYNSIIKENDDIYRQIARQFGFSECTFWILYSLREDNICLTQRKLCSMLSQPKQTVNSALKKLEADGYLKLCSGEDRRHKLIQLTEKGEALARKTLDKVMTLENRTFDTFTEEEQVQFLQLFRKYTDNLKIQLSERNLK